MQGVKVQGQFCSLVVIYLIVPLRRTGFLIVFACMHSILSVNAIAQNVLNDFWSNFVGV